MSGLREAVKGHTRRIYVDIPRWVRVPKQCKYRRKDGLRCWRMESHPVDEHDYSPERAA